MEMKTTFERALSRLAMLVGTILVVAVAPELINGESFDWVVVKDAALVALGYWILSTFKDFRDPDVPNSSEPQG